MAAVISAAPKTIRTFMLSFASGSQLAQSRPSGTSAVSVFTADMVTEITLIVVCNTTGSAAAFSIFHDDDGSTFDQTTALHYTQTIAANDTVYITSDAVGAGLFVAINGQIGVQTDTSNALTFSIYGITENIAQ